MSVEPNRLLANILFPGSSAKRFGLADLNFPGNLDSEEELKEGEW